MKYVRYLSILCLILPLCGACTVKPPEITVTGEKTVLERQLFGQYQLSRKAIFLPTAEGGVYAGTSELTRDTLSLPTSSDFMAVSGRRDYLIALANHRFNLDDINDFKDRGVIGENNEGYLHVFEDKVAGLSDADKAVLFNVVNEENSGRKIIMERVIKLRSDLTEEDLSEIQKIFARRNIEEETAGRMIQNEAGIWTVK